MGMGHEALHFVCNCSLFIGMDRDLWHLGQAFNKG